MSAANDEPLNTTEHILRRVEAILDEIRAHNNEFSWDLPSFIVTLVIGLIAAAFAGVAIVQALLAAGPGRLKSGKYAIGPWSKKTRWSFGSELRLRSTSETPVIAFESAKWNTMVAEAQENDEAEESTEAPQRTSTESVLEDLRVQRERQRAPPPRLPSSRKDPQDHFPATWLALLTVMNLDDPDLWIRKRVAADYIPADLPAVPAHGRIRDITNLALIASNGTAKLEFGTHTGQRLPEVRAHTMGLNFRDHPLLGLVGSFDLLNAEKDTLDAGFSTRALRLAHGIGRFRPIRGPVSTAAFVSSPEDSNKILRFFEDKFVDQHASDIVNGFILNRCPHQDIPQDRFYHEVHWKTGISEDKTIRSASYELPRDIRNQHSQYLAIALAAIPSNCKDTPPVFPVARADLGDKLAAFVIQSAEWSAGLSCFGIVFRDKDWGRERPEHPPQSHLKGTVLKFQNDEMGRTNRNALLYLDFLRDAFNTGVWKELAPLAFLQKGKGGHLREEATREQRSRQRRVEVSTRRLCQELIKNIDKWLTTSKPATRKEWNCAALAMSWTAWAIGQLEQKRLNLKCSMENSLQPLLREAELGGGEASADIMRFRDEIRSQWVKSKDDVYTVLQNQHHSESMLATLKTIVRLWERTWPEFGDEAVLKKREERGPDRGGEKLEHEPTQGHLHILSDLIIYRTILVVSLLSTAIDNTAILEDNSLERIVPFI